MSDSKQTENYNEIYEQCWKGQDFPNSSDVIRLTLPNGQVLPDACVWKNFMQNELGMCPDKFWKSIKKYPKHSDDDNIKFQEKGDKIRWIKGSHPALSYRGNAVRRNKIWCQRKYSKGMYKYGYTGWQHQISYATSSCRKIPVMKELMKKLDSGLPKRHTHWIITEYESHNDNIGFHSDKDKDFAENSYFIVIKLGIPRKFEFRLKRTKENPNPSVFFSEVLQAGTAILVRANAKHLDANYIVEHGVPISGKELGSSGSVVSRRIITRIPWKTVEKNIDIAKKAKRSRLLKKQ